jgi:hypothetical protein
MVTWLDIICQITINGSLIPYTIALNIYRFIKQVKINDDHQVSEYIILDYFERMCHSQAQKENMWLGFVNKSGLKDGEMFNLNIWALYYTTVTLNEPDNHYVMQKRNYFSAEDDQLSPEVLNDIKTTAISGDVRRLYHLLLVHFTEYQFAVMGY